MTILTADELPAGAELRTTVGVIGGGAAGIALALRLAERGVDCIVCESGADDFDQRTQDLYAGESNGYWDLTETRLRQFGGSTNHFAGQSRPLSVVDFGETPWRPGHAWPIDHAELARNIPRAAELMGLVPLEVGDDGTWATDALLPGLPGLDVTPTQARPDDPSFAHQLFQLRAASMAVNHRAVLAASDRATVVFGLNAVSVDLVDGGAAVDRVVLATLGGRRVELRADAYVLASGGIESPRLLLASTGRSPEGVANSSGLVGRYFADHPSTRGLPLVVAGSAPAPAPVGYVDGLGPAGDAAAVSHLGIADESQFRLGLPGFHARLSLLPLPFPDDVAALGVSALVDPGGATPEYAVSVTVGIDVVPNRESRVTLGEGRNELGERTAEVSWTLTEDDEVAMTRVLDVLARRLALLGVGRLDTRPPAGTWRDSVVGQHHHMGTLRMSSSPSAGVVDTNLRAHDVPNLYVAGSAVFPTFGHVNPTLNLTALSLRLADHLADEVVG